MKEVRNTHTAPPPPERAEIDVLDTVEKALYSPTPAAKKLKAKFWHRYIPSPLDDSSNISLATVNFYVNDSRMDGLWSKKGFKEWFLNKDEGREQIEYLFMLSMETAEEILTSEAANYAAKVNMIKIIAELANKFPSRSGGDKFTDDEINKMDQGQLESFLEKKGVKVRNTKKLENLEPEMV